MPFLFTLLILFLTSCGFQPVYKQGNEAYGNLNRLATIEVSDVTAKNQRLVSNDYTLLRSELRHKLNPTALSVPKEYRLSLTASDSSQALAVQSDTSITRYKVVFTVGYTLYKKGEKEPITQGSLRQEAGYDRVESDYATYIAERDSRERAMKEIATQLRIRLQLALGAQGTDS